MCAHTYILSPPSRHNLPSFFLSLASRGSWKTIDLLVNSFLSAHNFFIHSLRFPLLFTCFFQQSLEFVNLNSKHFFIADLCWTDPNFWCVFSCFINPFCSSLYFCDVTWQFSLSVHSSSFILLRCLQNFVYNTNVYICVRTCIHTHN